MNEGFGEKEKRKRKRKRKGRGEGVAALTKLCGACSADSDLFDNTIGNGWAWYWGNVAAGRHPRGTAASTRSVYAPHTLRCRTGLRAWVD